MSSFTDEFFYIKPSQIKRLEGLFYTPPKSHEIELSIGKQFAYVEAQFTLIKEPVFDSIKEKKTNKEKTESIERELIKIAEDTLIYPHRSKASYINDCRKFNWLFKYIEERSSLLKHDPTSDLKSIRTYIFKKLIDQTNRHQTKANVKLTTAYALPCFEIPARRCVSRHPRNMG